MTKDYIEKLIKLAKELKTYTDDQRVRTINSAQFISNINYLIGYILALEDTPTPTQTVGRGVGDKCCKNM